MRMRTRMTHVLRAVVVLCAVAALGTGCGSSVNVAVAAKTAVENSMLAACDAVSDYDCQNQIVVANCKGVNDPTQRKEPSASNEWTCDVTNNVTGDTITALHLYEIKGSKPTQLEIAGIDSATLRDELIKQ